MRCGAARLEGRRLAGGKAGVAGIALAIRIRPTAHWAAKLGTPGAGGGVTYRRDSVLWRPLSPANKPDNQHVKWAEAEAEASRKQSVAAAWQDEKHRRPSVRGHWKRRLDECVTERSRQIRALRTAAAGGSRWSGAGSAESRMAGWQAGWELGGRRGRPVDSQPWLDPSNDDGVFQAVDRYYCVHVDRARERERQARARGSSPVRLGWGRPLR